MKDKINSILSEAKGKISDAVSEGELQNVKSAYIGKQGSLSLLMKEIPTVDVALRPEMGKLLNQAKNEVKDLIDEKRMELVFEEDEITSEMYAFDKLNFPPNHPARESMDTYWLEGHDSGSTNEKLCLRPHLTGGSVRYMQTHKPPYRFVYPGRVYRNETTDAHHERAFFQYEALIVDKDITFTSGKVMIKSILSKVFGTDVPVRMRSGFFPFVEPGFEIDMQCQVCGGKGCSVCKHVGWIEVMPGGSPHPNVLRAAGLDPDEYTGFYVNIGLDRLVMMRYGVDDVRLFHSADLRFLKQFR